MQTGPTLTALLLLASGAICAPMDTVEITMSGAQDRHPLHKHAG